MRILNQRLRTLTTGILHSSEDEAKRDMERIIGEPVDGYSAEALHEALFPWLKSKLKDERFFAPVLDLYHTGETELPKMTADEFTEFWGRCIKAIYRRHQEAVKNAKQEVVA